MHDVPKIPYFQTSRYRVATMVELAHVKPEDNVADLGSGDGRIAIAFAKKGVEVHGYEIDAELRKTSEENIKKELLNRHPDSLPRHPESLSRHSEQSEEYILRFTQDDKDNVQDDKIILPIIYNKDFWAEDLSKYTIVCCYPMPDIMGRLENKLKHELKPGSRILLNYFPFLHWKEKAKKDNIFLYIR